MEIPFVKVSGNMKTFLKWLSTFTNGID